MLETSSLLIVLRRVLGNPWASSLLFSACVLFLAILTVTAIAAKRHRAWSSMAALGWLYLLLIHWNEQSPLLKSHAFGPSTSAFAVIEGALDPSSGEASFRWSDGSYIGESPHGHTVLQASWFQYSAHAILCGAVVCAAGLVLTLASRGQTPPFLAAPHTRLPVKTTLRDILIGLTVVMVGLAGAFQDNVWIAAGLMSIALVATFCAVLKAVYQPAYRPYFSAMAFGMGSYLCIVLGPGFSSMADRLITTQLFILFCNTLFPNREDFGWMNAVTDSLHATTAILAGLVAGRYGAWVAKRE